MYEFLIALAIFVITFSLTIFLILKLAVLTKVEYKIVLRNDDSTTILNKFDRIYWNPNSANKDIKKLEFECDSIRNNYINDDDFILSQINENFEIDYKDVYLEHRSYKVKPK